MTDYWWGVLSPFILILGVTLVLGVAYLIVAAARWLWINVHDSMIQTVKLKRNLSEVYGTGLEDDRPEYEDSANLIRDALLKSPKMYSFVGFGWRLALIREYRVEK